MVVFPSERREPGDNETEGSRTSLAEADRDHLTSAAASAPCERFAGWPAVYP